VVENRKVSDQPARTEGGAEDIRRRVLFVDDEAGILEGLRNVLRPQRKEWDMVFAHGGSAGISELKNSHFDVVVTDMRMPIVDGVSLLNQAKQLQPDAVRLVLSGQTDADTVLRSAFIAHQFMAKPCEPARLKELVTRSFNLQTLLGSEALRKLAGDVSSLPSAPKVTLELVRVLGDPKATTADAVHIVERDPSICAKILQVVNSAFFGLSRRVTSIEMAANYLGTIALRNLTLSMEAATAARANCNLSPDQFQRYQENVLLGASLARNYYKGKRQMADDAFMAAILRDMGWHIQTTLGNDGIEFGTPERSHAALGAYLLGLWGIPHAIIEAVAYHEHPEELNHDAIDLADVIHLADRVAAEVCPSPFETERPPLATAHLERLGMTQERMDAMQHEAREMASKIKENFT
jgi:HD-like signal output (HDOD) protein